MGHAPGALDDFDGREEVLEATGHDRLAHAVLPRDDHALCVCVVFFFFFFFLNLNQCWFVWLWEDVFSF
jgi:hypothetical protein